MVLALTEFISAALIGSCVWRSGWIRSTARSEWLWHLLPLRSYTLVFFIILHPLTAPVELAWNYLSVYKEIFFMPIPLFLEESPVSFCLVDKDLYPKVYLVDVNSIPPLEQILVRIHNLFEDSRSNFYFIITKHSITFRILYLLMINNPNNSLIL